MWHSTTDFEVWNGQMLSKARERVSCSHSYSCNCRSVCSGSGKNKSCSEVCDTCYEHSNDYDWVGTSDIGRIHIDRIDRQGRNEPPRFTKMQPGDPVAITRRFTNYIKAAPDSVFNKAQSALLLAQFEGKLPEYPNRVFDYHYVNRVLASGVVIPDLDNWNAKLALELRTLGVQKQANVVLVFTNEAPSFSEALSAKWLGGKKNDVLVVVGVKEYPSIEWVRVVSWAENELFKAELRDELSAIKELSPDALLPVISQHIMRDFKRRNWDDFNYLKPEPPMWLLSLLFLGSIMVSVGTSIALSRNSQRVSRFH